MPADTVSTASASAPSSAPSAFPAHIRLTSHSGGLGALPIHWGAATAAERGPVVGTTTKRAHRNVIGTHSGSYSVYRALAIAAGALKREHRADLTNTTPTDLIGPYPQWSDPGKIVSLDPWGAVVAEVVRRRAGGRLRHPPDHRRHQGARDPARGDGGAAEGPAQARRQVPDRRRRRAGDQGGDRAGLVPAGGGAALRLQRDRSAARAVRGDRRHVPGAGHALRPRGVPAADRRPDRLHLRRSARPRQSRRSSSRRACTTSATAPTCSAPTSAPAGPT